MTRTLLVLGGTSWLGGEVARQARDRGFEVTCLARGESGAAPDGTRHVVADRASVGAYDEVAGREWDAVVDVSWQPELVRSAVAALAPGARHWIYVSSMSVYADDSIPGQDEDAAVHAAWSGTGVATIEDYGPAKVSCETACVDALGPERLLVARAGLIVGHGDRSDRFGYWPGRIARAADDAQPVLVPPLDTDVQVIDVADLASWLVDSAETGRAGVYDAGGDTTTLRDVLALSAEAADVVPRLVEVDQQWLLDHEVAPWSGPESLPLWLPVPEYAGFMTRRNDRAKAAGLRLRPLAETVASALVWERELGLSRPRKAGLSPEHEAKLLAEA